MVHMDSKVITWPPSNDLYNMSTSTWLESTSWFTPTPYLTVAQRKTCHFLAGVCQMRIVIDIFVVGLLCVTGVAGNSIAILVLRTDNINKMVSFLLQAVAVADNAYLLACFCFQTLKAICDCTQWIPGFKSTFPYAERFIWPFASIAQMSAVWLVVLVTMDRYMAICRPFDTLRVWITLYARRAVFIIPIISLLYNMPRFFEQTPVVLLEKCSNQTRVWSRPSPLRVNKIYYIVYKVAMYFIFRMIIPMSMLIVLNVKLIQTLRIAKKDRAKLTLTQTKQRKDSFTLVLVVVVSVFICCQTPDMVLRTMLTMKYFAGFNLSPEYVNIFTNLLLTLNSSINCLIYCVTGRRFRCILKRLICRPCAKFTNRPILMEDGLSSENTSVIRKNKPTITSETSMFFPHAESRLESKC